MRPQRLWLVVLIGSLVLFYGCGEGDSATTVQTTNVQTPTALTYAASPAVYTAGVAITANTPSNSGGIATSYSVTPALPTGLNLNATTGVISGTPTIAVATSDYTIEASNTAGSALYILTITINSGTTYSLSGQVQKGPFSIGSQVAVNELDASLNPNGAVYNVQTSDGLGNFTVASSIGTNLVEIVADGFYMDELTGQLSSTQIVLRAVADLGVDATPTVNVLTSLQAQRLKTLLSQGKTYSEANTQSQTEVLAVFGIDSSKISSLSTLYSMNINGATDADSVLLATSAILSKMASNAAIANSTTQPAELSSYISTIAAQISSAGTITNAAITTAKNLAATQLNIAAVRTNIETYYADRAVTIVAPKFEEWVDASGSGLLPQRLVPATNNAPSANAGAAQTVLEGATVTLDGNTSTDPDGDPLAYQWSLTYKPTGSAVTSATFINATTSKPSFVPDVDGAYEVTLVVSDGKASSPAATVVITAQDTDAFQIDIDKAEPLSGSVQLSLSASTAGASVTWYVDLGQIGTGPTATWNTTADDASQLVMARIQVSDSKIVEVKRTVTVSNPSITISRVLSSTTSEVLSGTASRPVDIDARSPYGITSVSATFDGVSLGTLTAFNACPLGCFGPSGYYVYRFTVNPVQVGSGKHAMVVTATDAKGKSLQKTFEIVVSNPPTLSVSTPPGGAFVYGRLDLSGSYTTDKTGPATVTAKLGDVLFLTTTEQTFSGSYDLTGLTPGSYTLSVRVTDIDNRIAGIEYPVFVVSSSAMAHTPVMSLGANGKLLAAEGDRILYYSAEDQSVRLRDTTVGTEVTLQDVISASFWQISDGQVYASFQGNDCATSTCAYQWDAAGTRKNLSAANTTNTSGAEYLRVHSGFAILSNGDRHGLTVYDINTPGYNPIVKPTELTDLGQHHDLAVVSGVLNVFYDGSMPDESSSFFAWSSAVYRWTSDTNTSVRLSASGVKSGYPLTDGERVAWSQAWTGGVNSSLVVGPLSGGPYTVVSTGLDKQAFALRDGVLAWFETAGTLHAVKASTASGVTTLSELSSSRFYGTSGGYVVFGEAGKTYSWNAAQGTKRVLLEAAPGEGGVLVSGSTAYVVMGTAKMLYKFRID